MEYGNNKLFLLFSLLLLFSFSHCFKQAKCKRLSGFTFTAAELQLLSLYTISVVVVVVAVVVTKQIFPISVAATQKPQTTRRRENNHEDVKNAWCDCVKDNNNNKQQQKTVARKIN